MHLAIQEMQPRTISLQRKAMIDHRERLARIASRARSDTPISCPSASMKPLAPHSFDALAEPEFHPITRAQYEEAWLLASTPIYSHVETIQRAVIAEFPYMTLNDMKSSRRTFNIVRPRQIAMYLVKELTPRSLPQIGRRFGNRDHTTVLHAVHKIAALVEADQETAALVEKIKAAIAEVQS